MKISLKFCKKLLSFSLDVADIVASHTSNPIDDVAVKQASNLLRKYFSIDKK